MIGMFSARTNRERLALLEETIERLERKSRLTEYEQEQLYDARESAREIAQWLADLHRMEG